MRLTFIFSILFVVTNLHLVGAQDTEGQRVLFVGNSYTYFWNLPQQVATMAASENISMETRQSTSGGTNLGQHWRSEKGLQSRHLIKDGAFDIVIIQDHSMRALSARDSLLHFGRLFCEIIKDSGARPYLYMTWSRSWDPYMIAEIEKAYKALAEETGAVLVPVGKAWQRARDLRPDIPLYDPDGSHPSPMGTYLTACVFYGKLTGMSPIGLPKRLITEDKDGEKLYLNIQSEADALFCQKVAADILNEQN